MIPREHHLAHERTQKDFPLFLDTLSYSIFTEVGVLFSAYLEAFDSFKAPTLIVDRVSSGLNQALLTMRIHTISSVV